MGRSFTFVPAEPTEDLIPPVRLTPNQEKILDAIEDYGDWMDIDDIRALRRGLKNVQQSVDILTRAGHLMIRRKPSGAGYQWKAAP